MWVIFEGLDKTGKGTLEREFLHVTNFKHIVIDRGPVGYLTFDIIFNRQNIKSNANFINLASKIMDNSEDFMVVYCFADKDVVDKRLKAHNESCPYDYVEAQKLYHNNIRKYYKPEKTLEIDTSKKSVSECVQIIIEKLKEVQR